MKNSLVHIGYAMALFVLAFSALRHIWPDGIVFYQGFVLSVLVSAFYYILSLYNKNGTINPRDPLIIFLSCYTFMFTIPTTVDRAYSVKMLLELEKSKSGLTDQQIEDWFIRSFAKDGGVQKRLLEQQATNTITATGEKYQLTSFGEALCLAFKTTQVVFNTK